MTRQQRLAAERLPIRGRDLIPKFHESTCVASLDYAVDEMQLTIEFQERGTYVYFDFPPQEFALFNGAASRGTYFNLYIRDRYEYERIA